MSLTSIEFLVFVIVAVVGYYIIPKRCQWMWLLLFSYIYYASAGIQYLGFILYTTLVTYGTALVIHRIDQTDEAHKKDAKQKKKGVLILALLFVFGLLGVLKYTNFIVQNIDQLFHTDFGSFHLLLPIGLSFYTFQSAGYILDVYWNVSAKYSCGFPDPQVLPIIVVDRYLDYFTTIMEDRLWLVLAKPVFR